MKRRDVLQMLSAWAGASLLPAKAMSKKLSSPSTADIDGSAPKAFHINFDKERIKDLHYRLDRMIWPEMPFDTGWSAGTNDKVLKDLVQYWRHEYDWFKEQEKLNQLPHFKIPIEGEQLHFVHYKGTGKHKEFPLLVMHGWPSSFLEFTKAAPVLVKEGFDLVIPSLPGFAFSDAPKQPGVHPGRMADRMHQLMQALGYSRYGVQGSDWGGIVGTKLSQTKAEFVTGLHIVGSFWEEPKDRPLTADEQAFLSRNKEFNAKGRAYGAIQGTKPQTLAYGLQDSPVGLLAWILEKFYEWSDHGDNLWNNITREEVLTTVMLYWLTGRVYSSARIYYEANHMDWNFGSIKVPTVIAPYPQDPWTPVRSLLTPGPFEKLISYSEPPKGGHFPAMEQPEFWASDVAAFFSSL